MSLKISSKKYFSFSFSLYKYPFLAFVHHMDTYVNAHLLYCCNCL